MPKREEKNMATALLSSLLKYFPFKGMENRCVYVHVHTHTHMKELRVTDLWQFLLIRHLVQYRTDFLEENRLDRK